MTDTIVADDVADIEHRMISSNRIEGTPVFDRYAKKIGSIHSLMIGKESGQVAFAVLTFGGFLGVGSRAYPLPWSMLTYSREHRGYCLDLRYEDIDQAPYMTLDQADRPHTAEEPAYRHWDEYLCRKTPTPALLYPCPRPGSGGQGGSTPVFRHGAPAARPAPLPLLIGQ